MNLLLSYAVDSDRMRRLIKAWRNGILIDSGAFTVHKLGKMIDIGAYCEFCREYGNHSDGYIQLDVIGSARETDRNLDRMVSVGLRPIPVLTTDHDPKAVADMEQVNPWVCVAGGPFMSSAQFFRRVSKIREHAKDSTKLHGLGCTRNGRHIVKCGLNTVDSVSWVSGMKYGRRSMFDEITWSIVPDRRRFSHSDPPVPLAGRISSGWSWVSLSVASGYVRLYEALRRKAVDMFFAVGGAEHLVHGLVAAAMCTNSDWTTDWARLIPLKDRLGRMTYDDLAIQAELASMSLCRIPSI